MPQERNEEGFLRIPHKEQGLLGSQEKWLDDVDNDLKKMSVRGWRKITNVRDAWKLILKEARVLHGLWSQWREIINLHACHFHDLFLFSS